MMAHRLNAANQQKTAAQPAQKVNFRHQVDLDTPIGQIYFHLGKAKEEKRLIEESIIHCLLPHMYSKLSKPELAKEAAQFCIKKLTALIHALRQEYDLEPPNDNAAALLNASFLPIVEELKLFRVALTSQLPTTAPSDVVDELRLIRQSLTALQHNGSMAIAPPSHASPDQGTLAPPHLSPEDVALFVSGSRDFIDDLEEVL